MTARILTSAETKAQIERETRCPVAGERHAGMFRCDECDGTHRVVLPSFEFPSTEAPTKRVEWFNQETGEAESMVISLAAGEAVELATECPTCDGCGVDPELSALLPLDSICATCNRAGSVVYARATYQHAERRAMFDDGFGEGPVDWLVSVVDVEWIA